MTKKILVIIFALCLLLNTVTVQAQSSDYENFQMLSPLLDAVAYASIINNKETITEKSLSNEFIISFLRACRNNMEAMNITENTILDNASRNKYVQSHFENKIAELNDITLSTSIENNAVFKAEQYETDDSGLLQILGNIVYKDISKSAVIKLIPTSDNEFGFKIYSLLYNEELSYTNSSTDTFSYDTYYNDNYLYSIMIPNVFNDNEITYFDYGLIANSKKEDLIIETICKKSSESINDIIKELSLKYDVFKTEYNDSISMANISFTDKNGKKNVLFIIKGIDNIYSAQFTCSAQDFDKYTDIINVLNNSFIAEELSLG